MNDVSPPEEDLPGLRELARDLPRLKKIYDLLQGSAEFRSQALLEKVLVVGGISDAEEVAQILVRMQVARIFYDLSPREFFDASIANEVVLTELTDQKSQRTAAKLIIGLLKNEPLSTLARAASLRNESEHYIQRVRILTDLRPVFDENATLQGAIVTNTLRLDLVDTAQGGMRSVLVTLDEETLNHLRNQCERALEKNASIKDFATRSDLRVFGEEEP